MVLLRNVADACGVSKSTASKALRGYPDVAPETKRRIRMTAARMGYKLPSAEGQEKQLNRSMGLYLTQIRPSALIDPEFSAFQKGMVTRLIREDFDLSLITAAADPLAGNSLAARAIRKGLDGVCVYCMGGIPGSVYELLEGRYPALAVGALIPGAVGIICDDEGGMAMLARKALMAGRKRFCLLFGEDQIQTGVWRQAFTKAIRGLEEHAVMIPCSRGNRTGAERQIRACLEKGQVPDCVLCTDSGLAIGALTALTQAGIRVPEQVSLACLGDDLERHAGGHQITTAFRDMDRAGDMAADMLLSIIRGRQLPLRQRILLEELYFPGTTGGF